MARIGFQQGFDDDALGGAIHFADVIRVGFLGHSEVVEVVGGTVNQISGTTRGLHRDVEHGVHISTTFLMSWGNPARILVGIAF